MVQLFIDRKEELNFLEKNYKNASSLIIVYGRKRIGKTKLVLEFAKNKPSIYFLADERGDFENLKELQKVMAEYLEDNLFKKADIKDWVELFEEFSKRARNKPVVIIDEFPYLVRSNKAIPSIFQKIWDTILSKRDVCLILLGSSISMMEDHTLSYNSPLYGRRSGQWKLLPLKFKHLRSFFPFYGVEDLIKVYSVTDGIPAYILRFDPELSFEENLKVHVFRQGEFLYSEAEFLLKQELREPANYFNILKAIASGKHKQGEIVNFTGLDKTLVSKYLQTLLRIHVIKKEFPVTVEKELRNAYYVFEDNYYNFWFRFVYPNKTLIESEVANRIFDTFKEDFGMYISTIFEKVCREMVYDLLPFTFTKTGRWWHKEMEIDIVAISEKTREILFAECKWKDKINAQKVCSKLVEKAAGVSWNNNSREEYMAVFAKSFSKKIQEFEGKKVYCFDLKDFERQIRAR